MISFSSKGEFEETRKFLTRIAKKDFFKDLSKYGDEGVSALQKSTPKDTSKTSEQWFYEITVKTNYVAITWHNGNIVDGVPVAVLIQYGHGTRTGGYVQGIDYINPAIQPVFEKIAESVWREVISA